MKCDKCGTENNFEWATFCRSCQQPLGSPNIGNASNGSQSADSVSQTDSQPATKPLHTESDNIEIGVSDPMDYIMGASKKTDYSLSQGSPETVKPESADSGTTVYRDQDIKLSIAEAPDSSTVTLESLKEDVKISATASFGDTDSDEGSNLKLSESIIPSVDDLSDSPSTPPESEPDNALKIDKEPSHKSIDPSNLVATQKIKVNQSYGELKHPDIIEDHEGIEVSQNFDGQHDDKPSLSVDQPLPEVKQSKGVIYLNGKNLMLASGIKVRTGDEVTLNDKIYEIKAKPVKGWIFYAGIGVAAAVVLLATLFIVNYSSKHIGQLAGTVSNLEGIPVSGQRVTIDELGKTVMTNQAGFFVFEQIPAGIYTVSYKSPNGAISDRITILNNQTSTLAFREMKPQERQNEQPVDDVAIPSKQNIASSETKAPSGKGTLKLTLNPGNASAYIDGKPLGVGSNSYKLAEGSYNLTIRKEGFAEKNQTIRIESDKTNSVKVTLVEPASSGSSKKTDNELAYESETAGNYIDAIKYYSRALDKNPRDINALLGRARSYRADGRLDEAMSNFMQAAKVASDKGDVNSQIAALTGVIEIKPNTFTAYASRGELLYNTGQYNRAINDFSKVVELDTRNLGAYYKLGDCFYKTKDYSEALKTFLAAQELNFADPKAEACLAKTYLAMGDKKNCKKSYEKFKDLASYSARLEFKKDPEWQKVLTALGVQE